MLKRLIPVLVYEAFWRQRKTRLRGKVILTQLTLGRGWLISDFYLGWRREGRGKQFFTLWEGRPLSLGWGCPWARVAAGLCSPLASQALLRGLGSHAPAGPGLMCGRFPLVSLRPAPWHGGMRRCFSSTSTGTMSACPVPPATLGDPSSKWKVSVTPARHQPPQQHGPEAVPLVFMQPQISWVFSLDKKKLDVGWHGLWWFMGNVLNRHQDLEWKNHDTLSPKLFHLFILEAKAALSNRVFWNNKKWPVSMLPNLEATPRIWLWGAYNVPSATEELNFYFCWILINWNVSSHLWLAYRAAQG